MHPADHGVHAALDHPQGHREHEQRRAAAAPQATRRCHHREHELTRAPARRGPASERPGGDRREREPATDQRQGPARHAERQVERGDEHEEDEAERGRVEDPLGDERADHAGRGRARAARAEERLHEVARARREGVVAHVADRRERVRVAARHVGAAVVQQRAPALAAQERGERVQREAGAERGERGAGRRQVRQRLARRPPHDRRERGGRDGDLDGDGARARHRR
jgi:hypothetical protein